MPITIEKIFETHTTHETGTFLPEYLYKWYIQFFGSLESASCNLMMLCFHIHFQTILKLEGCNWYLHPSVSYARTRIYFKFCSCNWHLQLYEFLYIYHYFRKCGLYMAQKTAYVKEKVVTVRMH